MTTKDDQYHIWHEKIYKPLTQKYPERKKEFKTSSGIPIPPITPPDEVCPGYDEKLGFPGEYPFIAFYLTKVRLVSQWRSICLHRLVTTRTTR